MGRAAVWRGADSGSALEGHVGRDVQMGKAREVPDRRVIIGTRLTDGASKSSVRKLTIRRQQRGQDLISRDGQPKCRPGPWCPRRPTRTQGSCRGP